MRRHGVRRAEHGVISVAARAAEAVAVAAVRGVFGARDHLATHTVVGGVAVGVARAQVHVAAHAAKQTQLHVPHMPSLKNAARVARTHSGRDAFILL